MKLKNIILSSFFVSMALIFNLIESFFPLPLPGVKIGTANVFTLSALVTMGTRQAFIVTILRVSLAFIITGNVFSFFCGIVGGLLATATMALLYNKFKNDFSLSWISVAGAWAFNIGQTWVASYIVGDMRLMYYLFPLLVLGTVSGWTVGHLAELLSARFNQE